MGAVIGGIEGDSYGSWYGRYPVYFVEPRVISWTYPCPCTDWATPRKVIARESMLGRENILRRLLPEYYKVGLIYIFNSFSGSSSSNAKGQGKIAENQ